MATLGGRLPLARAAQTPTPHVLVISKHCGISGDPAFVFQSMCMLVVTPEYQKVS